MTYLELVNSVLRRLREKPVTTVDANPFTSVIGACVNDAMDSCQDAWNWSHLRQTDIVLVGLGIDRFIVPDSYNNKYQVQSMLNIQEGYYLRYVPQPWLRSRYRDSFTNPVGTDKPRYWCWGTDDESSGNKTIQLLKPSNGAYNFAIDRVKQQRELTDGSTRLLIPSKPVIALATALASRERGEIGGTPTSELFVLADRYLSDAIAYDSAKWEEEMDWYADTNMAQTNVIAY